MLCNPFVREYNVPMSDDNAHAGTCFVPIDIDSRIPTYFYPALAGELYSIYGPRVFEPCDGNLNAGTHGWYAAMRETCRKLNLGWLMDYYDALPWDKSELFDAEIEKRVCAIVTGDVYKWPNSYYEHLLPQD